MRRKKNKEIQRERTMKLFIDSAEKIIISEGVQGLSIRKVADYAGYNSATIYNYFDNLEHLIYFTYMNKIKSFYSLYSNKSDGKDPLESLYMNWTNISKLCYHYPREMQTLLYTAYNIQYETILADYLEIYNKVIEHEAAVKIHHMFGQGLVTPLNESISRFSEYVALPKEKLIEFKINIETFIRGMLDRQNSNDCINIYEEYMNISNQYISRLLEAYNRMIC